MNGDDLRHKLKQRSASSSDQRNVIDANYDISRSEDDDLNDTELLAPVEVSLGFELEKPFLITVQNEHRSENIEGYENNDGQMHETDKNWLEQEDDVEKALSEDGSMEDEFRANYDDLFRESNAGSKDSNHSFDFTFEHSKEVDDEDWMNLLEETNENETETRDLSSVYLEESAVSDNEKQFDLSLSLGNVKDSDLSLDTSTECKLLNDDTEPSGPKKLKVDETNKETAISRNFLADQKGDKPMTEKEKRTLNRKMFKSINDSRVKKTENITRKKLSLSKASLETTEADEDSASIVLSHKAVVKQKLANETSAKEMEGQATKFKNDYSPRAEKPSGNHNFELKRTSLDVIKTKDNASTSDKAKMDINKRELEKGNIQKQVSTHPARNVTSCEADESKNGVIEKIEKEGENKSEKVKAKVSTRGNAQEEVIIPETRLKEKEKENIRPKQKPENNREASVDIYKKQNNRKSSKKSDENNLVKKKISDVEVKNAVGKVEAKEPAPKVGTSGKHKKEQKRRTDSRSSSVSSKESICSTCSSRRGRTRSRSANSESSSGRSAKSRSSSNSSSSSSSSESDSDSSSSDEDNFKRRKRIEMYNSNDVSNSRHDRGRYGNRREGYSEYRDKRDRHYRPRNIDWRRRRSNSPRGGRRNSPIRGRRDRERSSERNRNYKREREAVDRKDRRDQRRMGRPSRSPAKAVPRRKPVRPRSKSRSRSRSRSRRQRSRSRSKSKRNLGKETSSRAIQDHGNKGQRTELTNSDKRSGIDTNFANIKRAHIEAENTELKNTDLRSASDSNKKDSGSEKLLSAKQVKSDVTRENVALSTKTSNITANSENLKSNKVISRTDDSTATRDERTDKDVKKTIEKITDLRQTLASKTDNSTNKLEVVPKGDISDKKQETEKVKEVSKGKSRTILIRDTQKKAGVETSSTSNSKTGIILLIFL